MSRWQEVRAEYRRIFEMDGTWRSSMSCLRDAQVLVCDRYARADRPIPPTIRFIGRSTNDCWCGSGDSGDLDEAAAIAVYSTAVATYDDWGDGPQCTMCGRLKEADHVD